MQALSSEFYSAITHLVRVSEPLPIIDNAQLIAEKVQLLQSLEQVVVATGLMMGRKSDLDLTLSNYRSLNATITPLSPDSHDWAVIAKYLEVGQPIHFEGQKTLKLIDAFAVERAGERQRFATFATKSNRMLLWHGSRLSNFAGILSQGMRVAPPEAPSSGYLFGKGCYFADMVEKSATYCFFDPADGYLCLALFEVYLGDSYHCEDINSGAKEEAVNAGKHSVFVVGQHGPTPDFGPSSALEDGLAVPVGAINATPVTKSRSGDAAAATPVR